MVASTDTNTAEKNKDSETQTKTLRNQKCLNELFTEYNRKRLPRKYVNILKLIIKTPKDDKNILSTSNENN